MHAGLAAVRGEACLQGHLIPRLVRGRTVVVAAGKAAVSMMAGACDILGPERVEGIVLTRYGHCGAIQLPAGVELAEAAHPVPDANGEAAARRILALAAGLTAGDRLIALISGGASALLTLPAAGITLAEKQALNRALLASGASIAEINCVRKHISAIKGGRLALAAYPARVETYCISDVAGDNPALIASGPTVPDTTTQADARAVLERYGIVPSSGVTAALADPLNALPAPDHPAFAGAQVRVVARPLAALEAAAGVLAGAGYAPVILGDAIEGEARTVGAQHAALALAHHAQGQRVALISGGECTVRLCAGAGRGGPNAEYLMALALGLDGAKGISALAVDTDGIDGSGDNAGAMINPTTVARAVAEGIDWAAALDANRSYDSFAALGDLVMTGPTLTNVNDLRIILIDP
ncbi:glycerate kinase [Erythrobacter sp. W302b]|uniref:glycerate kinase type-2 family protein n=1 Tax=Erythrobacter sp. W302b TaxID=3389874 RepID=UPI00396B12C2